MERLLTTDKIIQLAQEQHKLALWKKVQQAAVEICGESAYKVSTEIDIRDTSADYPGTHGVRIYDRDGDLLWSGGFFRSEDFADLDYETYIGEQISQSYEEIIKLSQPNDPSQQKRQIWFDLARNIVSNMLIEAGISIGMNYTLDEPPPRPIEVFTDIE